MKKIIFIIVIIISNTINSQNIILDSSFGVNGIAQIHNEIDNTYITRQITVLNDGKILVLASQISIYSNLSKLCRYLPNGLLDTTFGNNGTTVVDNNCFKFHLLDNGTVVLISYLYNSNGYRDLKIIKFQLNGIVDLNFANNGIYTTSGIIDLGGFFDTNNNLHFIVLDDNLYKVIKLNLTNGLIDTSFGNNGYVTLPTFASNLNPSFKDILKVENNDIYVSRKTNLTIGFTTTENYISKINTNGIFDQNFANNGSLLTSTYQSNYGVNWYPIYNLSSNIIYANNITTSNGIVDSSNLNKVLSNGLPDSTFNNNHQSFGINNIKSIKIKDNKIYLLCQTTVPNASSCSNLSFYRYLSTGALDLNFNSTGFFITSPACNQEFAIDFEILNDESLIVVGYYNDGSTLKSYLTKYKTQTLNTENFNYQVIRIENPIKDFLQVETSKKINQTKIFDLTGKQIINSNNSFINTSHLKSGLYALKIEFEDGTKHSQKLIKN